MSDDTLYGLGLAILLGLLPAFIARSKGYSFAIWWIFGAVLLIAALLLALFTKRNQAALDARRMKSEDLKACPACAELVRKDATVCRYCHRPMAEPAV